MWIWILFLGLNAVWNIESKLNAPADDQGAGIFLSNIRYQKISHDLPNGQKEIMLEPIAFNHKGLSESKGDIYRIEYRKLSGTLYDYKPLGLIKDTSIPEIDPTHTQFNLWEVKQNPHAGTLFQFMSASREMADLIIKDPSLSNYMPDVFILASTHNTELFKQMLGYHLFVNWDTDKMTGKYIMQPSQLGDILTQLLRKESWRGFPDHFDALDHVLKTFSGRDWGLILRAMIQTNHLDSAIWILKDVRIMSKVENPMFRSIFRLVISHPLRAHELIDILNQAHVAERFSSGMWAKILFQALAQDQESLIAALVHNQSILQRLSDADFHKLIDILVTRPAIVDRINSLLQTDIANRITGKQWTQILLKLVSLKADFMLGRVISNKDVIAKLSNAELVSVIDQLLEHPPLGPYVLSSLSEDHVAPRISGPYWGKIIYNFDRTQRVDALLSPLMNKGIFERIPLFQFRDFINHIKDIAFYSPNLIHAFLNVEHLYKHITPGDWTDFLFYSPLNGYDYNARTILDSSDVTQQLSSEQFTKVLHNLFENSFPSPELTDVLMKPHLVNRISGKEWTVLLSTLVARRRFPAAARVLSNTQLLSQISDQDIKRVLRQIIASRVQDRAVVQVLMQDHLAYRITDRQWGQYLDRLYSSGKFSIVEQILQNEKIMDRISISMKAAIYEKAMRDSVTHELPQTTKKLIEHNIKHDRYSQTSIEHTKTYHPRPFSRNWLDIHNHLGPRPMTVRTPTLPLIRSRPVFRLPRVLPI